MILGSILRDLVRPRDRRVPEGKVASEDGRPSVLNVGGDTKQITIPDHYRGWTHTLLDVDAARGPDIVCDARNLASLAAGRFDAVYCSHNLEHYYPHDAMKVLQGFRHILKPAGFAEIRVPDMNSVMTRVVNAGMDIEDVLYQSPAGPITVRDVIYGWGKQIETSRTDFYAHKNGFTRSSLHAILRDTGFGTVLVTERVEIFELRALAFKTEPTDQQRALLAI